MVPNCHAARPSTPSFCPNRNRPQTCRRPAFAGKPHAPPANARAKPARHLHRQPQPANAAPHRMDQPPAASRRFRTGGALPLRSPSPSSAPATPTQTRNLQQIPGLPPRYSVVKRRRSDNAPARRRRLDPKTPTASQTRDGGAARPASAPAAGAPPGAGRAWRGRGSPSPASPPSGPARAPGPVAPAP